MKIQFIKPSKASKSGVKISLQKGGKLSFNKGAIDQLGITAKTYFKVGIDKDNPAENAIYLFKTDENDQLGKPIMQVGGKTQLTVGYVLEELNLDYKNKYYYTKIDVVGIENQVYIKIEFLDELN